MLDDLTDREDHEVERREDRERDQVITGQFGFHHSYDTIERLSVFIAHVFRATRFGPNHALPDRIRRYEQLPPRGPSIQYRKRDNQNILRPAFLRTDVPNRDSARYSASNSDLSARHH